MRVRNAFTLIELLVVIAIIAILAAILFPVFAQAKLAAKKAASISNVKQLLLAAQMYVPDNEGMFHLIRSKVDLGWTGLNWAIGAEDMLKPYIKNEDLFGDPADTFVRDDCNQPFGKKVSYSWTHYRDDDIRVHGVHGYNHSTWTPAQARPSLNETQLGAPASTIHLYPLWTTASYTNGYSYYRWYTDEIGSVAGPIPTFPRALSFTWCSASPGAGRMSLGAYGNQSVWGFADGHVKTMARDQTKVQTTPWQWSQAQIDAGARNLFHYDERFKN